HLPGAPGQKGLRIFLVDAELEANLTEGLLGPETSRTFAPRDNCLAVRRGGPSVAQPGRGRDQPRAAADRPTDHRVQRCRYPHRSSGQGISRPWKNRATIKRRTFLPLPGILAVVSGSML